MNDRDTEIIELTLAGMSANKVRSKLGLDLSTNRVQQIARKYLGRTRRGNFSQVTQISYDSSAYRVVPGAALQGPLRLRDMR